MTLDEAIKHAEEIAEEQESRGYCDRSVCVIMDENNHNCDECEVVKCRECAEEHRQLAEWLKDYKRLLEQEHCEDAISRQATVERLCRVADFMNEKRKGLGSPYVMAALFIQDNKDEFPPVTPQQKMGQWIEVIDKVDSLGNKTWHYECSICGSDKSGWGTYKHCPDCGTKMEVQE